jgi:hypothetical protein
MPHFASDRSNHTQESLRGGVPPFNGGCALLGFPEGLARQDNPQIRVLPPLGNLHDTSIDRLPLRLQQLIKYCNELTLAIAAIEIASTELET